MAFIGSHEITMLFIVLLMLVASALPVLFILYYVFKRRDRVRELEARVTGLEKELADKAEKK